MRAASPMSSRSHRKELDEFLRARHAASLASPPSARSCRKVENRIELASEQGRVRFFRSYVSSTPFDRTGGAVPMPPSGRRGDAKGAGAKEIWPGRAIGPQHLLGGTSWGQARAIRGQQPRPEPRARESLRRRLGFFDRKLGQSDLHVKPFRWPRRALATNWGSISS